MVVYTVMSGMNLKIRALFLLFSDPQKKEVGGKLGLIKFYYAGKNNLPKSLTDDYLRDTGCFERRETSRLNSIN